MLLAAVFAWASFVGPALAASFVNPIVAAAARTGSADPSVVFHRGYYFYCRVIGNGEIGIARARRLQDIGAAPMVSVFKPPAGTPYSRQVWAPELQRVRGRWYIYFSASDGVNANHRMVALQAETDDPQGDYAFKGRVADPADGWAIDGTVLELGGRLYFVWSGWPDAAGPFPQVLYIAAMSDPWTISGERHLIAAPEFDWERAGAPLLEAPQPLHHRGTTHIVYSAGASWGDDYALGLLRYARRRPAGRPLLDQARPAGADQEPRRRRLRPRPSELRALARRPGRLDRVPRDDALGRGLGRARGMGAALRMGRRRQTGVQGGAAGGDADRGAGRDAGCREAAGRAGAGSLSRVRKAGRPPVSLAPSSAREALPEPAGAVVCLRFAMRSCRPLADRFPPAVGRYRSGGDSRPAGRPAGPATPEHVVLSSRGDSRPVAGTQSAITECRA